MHVVHVYNRLNSFMHTLGAASTTAGLGARVPDGGDMEQLRRPAGVQQGWKLMSCTHCQELGQQASWLLNGCTRVNNKSEAMKAS